MSLPPSLPPSLSHIVVLVFLKGLDVVGVFLEQQGLPGWIVWQLHILHWSTSLHAVQGIAKNMKQQERVFIPYPLTMSS